METVFDALKAMGKATSIELAARLDISREEVLNELWELKKAGFVDKSAYTWRVADNNVQQEQPAQAELPEETSTATVAKISECDLTATIEQHGPQTADELATLFGTTSRKVASTLAMAISKGRLIRANQDGKFRYCMPGDNLPAEPKAASVAETDGKAFPQPAGVACQFGDASIAACCQSRTSSRQKTGPEVGASLRRAAGAEQAPGYCSTYFRFLQSYCAGKVIPGEGLWQKYLHRKSEVMQRVLAFYQGNFQEVMA